MLPNKHFIGTLQKSIIWWVKVYSFSRVFRRSVNAIQVKVSDVCLPGHVLGKEVRIFLVFGG